MSETPRIEDSSPEISTPCFSSYAVTEGIRRQHAGLRFAELLLEEPAHALAARVRDLAVEAVQLVQHVVGHVRRLTFDWAWCAKSRRRTWWWTPTRDRQGP
jgi:hypothetical protein